MGGTPSKTKKTVIKVLEPKNNKKDSKKETLKGSKFENDDHTENVQLPNATGVHDETDLNELEQTNQVQNEDILSGIVHKYGEMKMSSENVISLADSNKWKSHVHHGNNVKDVNAPVETASEESFSVKRCGTAPEKRKFGRSSFNSSHKLNASIGNNSLEHLEKSQISNFAVSYNGNVETMTRGNLAKLEAFTPNDKLNLWRQNSINHFCLQKMDKKAETLPSSKDSQYYSQETTMSSTYPDGWSLRSFREEDLLTSSSHLVWSDNSMIQEDLSGSLNSLSTEETLPMEVKRIYRNFPRSSRPNAAGVRRHIPDDIPFTARF